MIFIRSRSLSFKLLERIYHKEIRHHQARRTFHVLASLAVKIEELMKIFKVDQNNI